MPKLLGHIVTTSLKTFYEESAPKQIKKSFIIKSIIFFEKIGRDVVYQLMDIFKQADLYWR